MSAARVWRAADLAARRLVVGMIRGYQLVLSAFLGRHCRFEPTCSVYCQQAVHRHGVGKGCLLGIVRICRCGPGGGHGFDPVPAVWQDALPRWMKRFFNSNS